MNRFMLSKEPLPFRLQTPLMPEQCRAWVKAAHQARPLIEISTRNRNIYKSSNGKSSNGKSITTGDGSQVTS